MQFFSVDEVCCYFGCQKSDEKCWYAGGRGNGGLFSHFGETTTVEKA
ncbi:hypothetical protein QZR14_00540 [Pseudomonas sp. rhizo66]|nr:MULTISPECIES: hypothetical protein [unclassified Pseudomonas]MCL9800440.1 hypothetical protein [Pseudomonas sp. AKS31]MDT3309829.1 hypothetical protein [Pseudomonas sp. rhizo66]